MVESILLRSVVLVTVLLSGVVTSIVGRAVQYSYWNGFDLTTKAGTNKLKEDLLQKKPWVVWMTPRCTKQGWCEAILQQMWVERVSVVVVSSQN